ncbi:MAG: SRPBCC domain-containing protein, partial [Anaerolineae bacterium]
MSEKRQVKQKVVVETTPELAFEALTAASELREWFCDGAWTQVQPAGRYGLHWNPGYHVEGKFVKLDPPHSAVVTWLGSGEPGETKVKFVVEPQDEAVEVRVIHKGFGSGEAWDKVLAEAEKGWVTGLENLKSTLETGVDLRVARQPFLGILLGGQVDAERAANEGIAVEHGIYVNDTLESSGARAAGLGKGDVIVGLGGAEILGYQELTDALRAHQAGDVVEVDLVNGQERRTVEMTLGQRPQVEVPESGEGLAAFVAEQYKEGDAALKAAIEGIGEAEAEQVPEGQEWSVKDVLAHLSISERGGQEYVASQALNGWLDGGPGNTTAMR